MDIKRFKRIDLWLGVVVFMVSAYTYLSTIEPTASFWDCGEFIASSYKLEIGHPPGNPVFQIIARIFTLFGNKEQAAVLVNAMSALCGAVTILFLFWSITHLGRRIWERNKESLSMGNAIAVLAAGVVGALACNFSDTFWFSAVEAEVYAMSSLFTAAVFWAMLKWEEQADLPYANRWIVLISYLMGLSIGVHLLNLLTIPALVFVYYYKKHTFSWKGAGYTFAISVLLLALILYGIIPGLPKIASWFDLLFVNVFGFGFNTGAAFFMILLSALCFWGIFYTFKKGKVLWNTIILCFTVMMIGYSSFAVIIIRSSANTPTNENQPDNPFALIRYLARDQYGSNPLIYGESFATPLVDIKTSSYYTKVDGKYQKVPGRQELIYDSHHKMLFPRMWSSHGPHARFYRQYTQSRGEPVPGGADRLPLFRDNLSYFFDYQVNFMYTRYFMWNFVGRQNDLHAQTPGDLFRGNWESGIGFIDRARLGDQRNAPDYLAQHKAKNHFYFLPLILGLIGLFYQYAKDRRNSWVVFLLFFLTGLAIVIYLNQTPYQPRERDYAYAGSFYAFTIWIGLGVMAIYEFLKKRKLNQVVSACVAGALCLAIPIQMGSQTWDDHDRSHRYTARDMAYNYLQSCGPQAILITVGDNDTFPLWYIQEVEGIRTDVRILNTSLLGTDWYINQMQYQMYDSPPLPFSLPQSFYIGSTNDGITVEEMVGGPIPLSTVMEFFTHPNARRMGRSGVPESFMPARRLLIPVNKENVAKYGIVSPQHLDKVLDTIEITLTDGYITKPDMMVLDMLNNYQWDRPICFTTTSNNGLRINFGKHLQFDGVVSKLVPMICQNDADRRYPVDTDIMYDRLMHTYALDRFADPRIYVDYQNLLTFQGVIGMRNIFAITAKALLEQGRPHKAIEVLDRMQEVFPAPQYPLNTAELISAANTMALIDAVEVYAAAGAVEKATQLGAALAHELLVAIVFFGKPDTFSESDLQTNYYLLLSLIDVVEQFDREQAEAYSKQFRDRMNSLGF